MKKFTSLQITFEKLQQQVSFLTTESIKRTREFNTITTKLSDAKKELSNTNILIEQGKKDAIVDIKNKKKDFIQQLNNKEVFLNQKEKALNDKEYKLDVQSKVIEKRVIYIQKAISKLQKLHFKVVKILYILRGVYFEIKKYKKSLEMRDEIITIQERESFSNLIDSQKEKDLVNTISEYLYEDMRLDIEKIESQKKSLKRWEKDLKQREETYKSDMRTLISAKNSLNKK